MSEGKIVWREVHIERGNEKDGATPAVRVTHGGRAMYSYTAGVVDKEGNFRPYLHLSDVYITEYVELFKQSALWVHAARAKKRDESIATLADVAKVRG